MTCFSPTNNQHFRLNFTEASCRRSRKQENASKWSMQTSSTNPRFKSYPITSSHNQFPHCIFVHNDLIPFCHLQILVNKSRQPWLGKKSSAISHFILIELSLFRHFVFIKALSRNYPKSSEHPTKILWLLLVDWDALYVDRKSLNRKVNPYIDYLSNYCLKKTHFDRVLSKMQGNSTMTSEHA